MLEKYTPAPGSFGLLAGGDGASPYEHPGVLQVESAWGGGWGSALKAWRPLLKAWGPMLTHRKARGCSLGLNGLKKKKMEKSTFSIFSFFIFFGFRQKNEKMENGCFFHFFFFF